MLKLARISLKMFDELHMLLVRDIGSIGKVGGGYMHPGAYELGGTFLCTNEQLQRNQWRNRRRLGLGYLL